MVDLMDIDAAYENMVRQTEKWYSLHEDLQKQTSALVGATADYTTAKIAFEKRMAG